MTGECFFIPFYTLIEETSPYEKASYALWDNRPTMLQLEDAFLHEVQVGTVGLALKDR